MKVTLHHIVWDVRATCAARLPKSMDVVVTDGDDREAQRAEAKREVRNRVGFRIKSCRMGI